MKFISVPIFILSLAIGLFVVYITAPKAQVIYVYPNPDNEDKVTFQDKADNCFQFKARTVNCPSNTNKIKNYKIQ